MSAIPFPTLADRLGDDSVSTFESSASRRLDEAEYLAADGRNLAAIYLFGYVAESRMKASRYRLLGLHPNDAITRDMRNWIRSDFKNRFPAVHLNDRPHDLQDEAVMLIYTRKWHTIGYDRVLRRELDYHATALNGHWRPAIRYRVTVPLPSEVVAARAAAHWFEVNYARLWS